MEIQDNISDILVIMKSSYQKSERNRTMIVEIL